MDNITITPEWLGGFFDGEGAAMFSFSPRKENGFRVCPVISITNGNHELLYRIQEYLGTGRVGEGAYDTKQLRFTGVENIKKFISEIKSYLNEKGPQLEILEEIIELKENHQGCAYSQEELLVFLELDKRLRILHGETRSGKSRKKYTISELRSFIEERGDL